MEIHASKLALATRCGAWHGAPDGPQSPAAALGTDVDAAVKAVLLGGAHASCSLHAIDLRDRILAVCPAVTAADVLVQYNYTEQTVHVGKNMDTRSGLWFVGTLDLATTDEVIDIKTTAIPFFAGRFEAQVDFYAFCMGVPTAGVICASTKTDEVRVERWAVDRDHVLRRLDMAADRALLDTDPVVGKHCYQRFCPAKGTCTAYKKNY